MNQLETEINYQGRTLWQISRSEGAAIYEIRNKANTLYGYEVIQIKIFPEQDILGRHYPDREAYPAPEDWGHLAWTFAAKYKEAAFDAFNSLLFVNPKIQPLST